MTLKSINAKDESHQNEVQSSGRDMLILIGSLLILLLGAYLTVWSAGSLAHYLGIPSILIGILVVALGTTMPELFFALKSVKQCHDDMAIGDILGTVLADATIVIGILALLTPFEFPKTTIYIAGIFMVAAAFMLFSFMRSGRSVTRLETFALFIFWLTFVSVEYIVNVVG